MSDNVKKANAAPRCQYIRLNDQPCTQPALKDNVFCRFHEFLDHPLPAAQIPFVEDATTLQVALMQVIRSLQLGQINRATAGTILYALQIAAQNLKHFAEESGHPFAQPNASRKRDKEDEKEDEEELEGPSLAEILLDRLQIIEKEDAAERAASAATQTPPPPRPSASPAVKPDSTSGVIDKLEACAESQRDDSLVAQHEVLGQVSFGRQVPKGRADLVPSLAGLGRYETNVFPGLRPGLPSAVPTGRSSEPCSRWPSHG
jgi:hypothetical protein